MSITQLFDDQDLVAKIQERLPQMFQIAEQESSRGGRVGMEVGSIRERILIALLIYKFGEPNVTTKLPITYPEADVKVFDTYVSIKSITGSMPRSVKLVWTVDQDRAHEFAQVYSPSCDILLAQLKWGDRGGLFWFPLSAQRETLNNMGRNAYMTLPKPGTNPRGVEMTREAVRILTEHPESRRISIQWEKRRISHRSYQRWLELWQEP